MKAKTTKQGVRDLNTPGNRRHEHKFFPETYNATIKFQGQSRVVQRQRMACLCGEVQEEHDEIGEAVVRNYYGHD